MWNILISILSWSLPLILIWHELASLFECVYCMSVYIGPLICVTCIFVFFDLENKQSSHNNKQICASGCTNCSQTHGIISLLVPHELNVIIRTTMDEFDVIPRTTVVCTFTYSMQAWVGWLLSNRCRKPRTTGYNSRRTDGRGPPLEYN